MVVTRGDLLLLCAGTRFNDFALVQLKVGRAQGSGERSG